MAVVCVLACDDGLGSPWVGSGYPGDLPSAVASARVSRADVDHHTGGDCGGRDRVALYLRWSFLAPSDIVPFAWSRPTWHPRWPGRDDRGSRKLLAKEEPAEVAEELLPTIMTDQDQESEFERLEPEKELSLIGEFLVFIRENKAWWMVPILLTLGAVGVLALLTSTGAAPFIYTLF
jgi:hypothetical protein